MPHWSAGRTFFQYYYYLLTLLNFLQSSNKNGVDSFTSPFAIPTADHPHSKLHRGVIDRRPIIILQLSSSVEMMEPGGSSGAPEYELQSFQLTAEERQQQQQHLQYVEANDDVDDDDDYQTQYSTADSQLLHQQQQAASHDADVHWSIRSNAFFVTGGIIYLMATSWDWSIYSRPAEQVENLHNVLNTPQYIFYQFLWIMGPFVYLLNSFIDVKWALLQRERDAVEKDREFRRSHLEAILNTAPSPDQPHHKQTRRLRINAVLKRPKNLLRRMRKHIGHRRQLGAATTFGVAAGLSVVAALLGLFVTDGSDNLISQDSKDILSIWVSWLESGSIHMYLVSAALALWRSPWKSSSSDANAVTIVVEPITVLTPWYSRTESLETLGDMFFGIAAMVDVCLCDSTLDDGIYWWPVVSAVLWLVDALFYLRGDFATLYKE
jgi:hypothetical protein